MEQLSALLFEYSHLGVFISLLIVSFGLPIPEDIILITGGVVSARDNSLLLMNLAGMSGVLVGDSIIYWLGYYYGEALLKRRPFRWLMTPERLQKVRAYYQKYGYWTIFFSRFAAGLRASSFMLAGTSHVPYRIFLLANGMAALISVPFFIGLGYYFSDNIQAVIARMKTIQGDILIVLAVALVLFLLYRKFWKKPDPPSPEPPHAEMSSAPHAPSIEGTRATLPGAQDVRTTAETGVSAEPPH